MANKLKGLIILFFLIFPPCVIYVISGSGFIYTFLICLWCFLFVETLSIFNITEEVSNKLYSKRLVARSKNKSAKQVNFGKFCSIHYPNTITFGNNVTIGHNVEMFPLPEYHGERFTPEIKIGNNVIIGDYNRFACKDSIIIEDNVLFAAYVHITDHSHEYRNPSISVREQGVFEKGPVKIGKGSWIGLRCSILSGVSIGEHCVIGAGSIVTKDIPPYSIAVGAPAKVVKQYDFQIKEWVDIV